MHFRIGKQPIQIRVDFLSEVFEMFVGGPKTRPLQGLCECADDPVPFRLLTPVAVQASLFASSTIFCLIIG